MKGEQNENGGGTLPGAYSRYIVTTLVNIGDFCVFTRNIARNKPSADPLQKGGGASAGMALFQTNVSCCKPLAHARGSVGLAGADLELADLGADAFVIAVLAQVLEVRVLHHPLEISIAEIEGKFQRFGSEVALVGERVATGEVVMNQRIVWFDARKLFVNTKTFVVTATTGVVISQNLESIHIPWIPADDPFHKLNFKVQIAQFLTGRPLARGGYLFCHSERLIDASGELVSRFFLD